jgi:hypothetical protein
LVEMELANQVSITQGFVHSLIQSPRLEQARSIIHFEHFG